MSGAFWKLTPEDFDIFGRVTGSLASAAGLMPSSSQAGPRTAKSGPQAVRVSRFRGRAVTAVMPINAISGPLFTASSPSAVLQRSLENRLRQRLGASGSPEFALIWKTWDMPAGPPISRLQASVRRTVVNGSSGWPTPDASLHGAADLDRLQARRTALKAKGINGNGFGLTLTQAVASWATPQERDWRSNEGSPEFHQWRAAQTRGKPLQEQAHQVVPWATPTEGDAKASGSRNTTQSVAHSGYSLTDQVRGDFGIGRNGSTASTAKRGAFLLNPEFARWLQGFPVEWGCCAPTGMPSFPKRRRSS